MSLHHRILQPHSKQIHLNGETDSRNVVLGEHLEDLQREDDYSVGRAVINCIKWAVNLGHNAIKGMTEKDSLEEKGL